jgi:hypothetical protein
VCFFLAGLYARSRKSELMQIAIPVDNIAFQIGETAQVHSGGYLQVSHERMWSYEDVYARIC